MFFIVVLRDQGYILYYFLFVYQVFWIPYIFGFDIPLNGLDSFCVWSCIMGG